ncbi:hypothetical protein CCR97_01745 [Rhodoplanes elegans]|uniref:Uncharacterized protein n=1 Tax=Rhodoplanes elegans TaxID=29408 RepID=A0A327KBN2_9BRAD|nr:hypothetical protein [Rhodoplanes elegans]RAI35571.1 hypothetical protein CH338_19020 [Rhodoplanes elegans]
MIVRRRAIPQSGHVAAAVRAMRGRMLLARPRKALEPELFGGRVPPIAVSRRRPHASALP